MGNLSRAQDALCDAITTDNGVEAAFDHYRKTVLHYALTDLDEAYAPIRAAVQDLGPTDSNAFFVMRWCEDVNARVLARE